MAFLMMVMVVAVMTMTMMLVSSCPLEILTDHCGPVGHDDDDDDDGG